MESEFNNKILSSEQQHEITRIAARAGQVLLPSSA
jgi:hypothetical protein